MYVCIVGERKATCNIIHMRNAQEEARLKALEEEQEKQKKVAQCEGEEEIERMRPLTAVKLVYVGHKGVPYTESEIIPNCNAAMERVG